jgi:hypothetical protein
LCRQPIFPLKPPARRTHSGADKKELMHHVHVPQVQTIAIGRRAAAKVKVNKAHKSRSIHNSVTGKRIAANSRPNHVRRKNRLPGSSICLKRHAIKP